MNVFAYRLPGEKEAFIYRSDIVEKTDKIPQMAGFLFSPFFFDGNFRFMAGAERLLKIPENLAEENVWNRFDSQLTEKSTYVKYVEDITRELLDNPNHKIVASRRKMIQGKIDFNGFFSHLCKVYPEDYVYFISTPEWGTYLGVSPELLLKKDKDCLSTMSLAGTRPAGTPLSWDSKNIVEQRIVTDFIAGVFRSLGFSPQISNRTTKRAGAIEHLKTDISTKIDTPVSIENLILALYPTPALSGFPKIEAMEWIRRYENDGRGLYGGFSGPVSENGDFEFYVNLRCLATSPGGMILFAGGGITQQSDPDDEWMETERKLSTLLSQIKDFDIA